MTLPAVNHYTDSDRCSSYTNTYVNCLFRNRKLDCKEAITEVHICIATTTITVCDCLCSGWRLGESRANDPDTVAATRNGAIKQRDHTKPRALVNVQDLGNH